LTGDGTPVTSAPADTGVEVQFLLSATLSDRNRADRRGSGPLHGPEIAIQGAQRVVRSQLSSWFFALLSAKTSNTHLPLSFICFGDGGVEHRPGSAPAAGPSVAFDERNDWPIGNDQPAATDRVAPPLVAAPVFRGEVVVLA